MNHYDPDTGILTKHVEIDILSLFKCILDQNEMILKSNEKMIEVLGAPRFLYHNKLGLDLAEELGKGKR